MEVSLVHPIRRYALGAERATLFAPSFAPSTDAPRPAPAEHAPDRQASSASWRRAAPRTARATREAPDSRRPMALLRSSGVTRPILWPPDLATVPPILHPLLRGAPCTRNKATSTTRARTTDDPRASRDRRTPRARRGKGASAERRATMQPRLQLCWSALASRHEPTARAEDDQGDRRRLPRPGIAGAVHDRQPRAAAGAHRRHDAAVLAR